MKKCLYLINKETGYVITCKNKNEYETTLQFLGDYWKPCQIDPVVLNEPLIDSEKERIVIRTWAEAINITEVIYDKFKDCIYTPKCDEMTVSISFDRYSVFEKLEHGRLYTIIELCGEEKKC